MQLQKECLCVSCGRKAVDSDPVSGCADAAVLWQVILISRITVKNRNARLPMFSQIIHWLS